MICSKELLKLKISFLLGFLFSIQGIFAVIPINEKSLQGIPAAEARLKLLEAAESCLGTPYRYAGIDRRGLDCSGLVYLSFREGLKYAIPRTAEGIYAWAEKINTSELQIGDLVFFVTTGPGVSHLGIYAGEGRFIHSASEGPRTGVIFSRLDEAYWKRTYKGAGRALPWDETIAQAMDITVDTAKSTGPEAVDTQVEHYSPGFNPGEAVNLAGKTTAWKDPGFYAGFGAAWIWGGYFEGSHSVFRGFSALAMAGYKGSTLRMGLELRPIWDGALGVFRLPFTFSIGTDIFQVFGGPAYAFGDPSLGLNNGEKYYSGGAAWYWEAGFSGALPPIRINSGILSFFGELVWQPYRWRNGENLSIKPDSTANLRLSTGLRYLWHL